VSDASQMKQRALGNERPHIRKRWGYWHWVFVGGNRTPLAELRSWQANRFCCRLNGTSDRWSWGIG